jgi:hypothetical protein
VVKIVSLSMSRICRGLNNSQFQHVIAALACLDRVKIKKMISA